MKKVRILILLFSVIHYCGLAQFMNVRSWKKTERDSLEQGLLFLEEKKMNQALPIFENMLSNHPDEEFLKYSYAKCALNSADKQTEAYKRLSEVYEKNRKTPDIQYYLAFGAYYNSNYDEALTHITAYLSNRKINAGLKQNAEALKKQISYGRYFFTHPTRARVFNLGSVINTEFNESNPVMAANEEKLFYTYTGPSQSAAFQKKSTSQILVSQKEDGEFVAAQPFSKAIAQQGNVVAVSNDASILFFSIETSESGNDLYYRVLNGKEYGILKKLKGLVNSPYNENHCSLSPDGRTLYFSSNRPEGKGGHDLYRASLSDDSTWVNVVNLGDSVNTALDEASPFIHADGRTLFFNSKGHVNMGGYDLFKTTLNVKDSSFRKTENLGYPLNSPSDEEGFVISANGENAYYCSNRKDGKGRFDVYHAEPRIKGFKPSLCLLKGKILKNEQPTGGSIKVNAIGANKKLIATLIANSTTGNYLITLPTGAEYELTYTIAHYKPKTTVVDLTDMTGFVEKIKNMSFDAVFDSIKPDVRPQIAKETTTNNIAPPLTEIITVINTPTSTIKTTTVVSGNTVATISNNTLTAVVMNTITTVPVKTIQTVMQKTTEAKPSNTVAITSLSNTSTMAINTASQAVSKTTSTSIAPKGINDSLAFTAVSSTVSKPQPVITPTPNTIKTEKKEVKEVSQKQANKDASWNSDNFEPNTATQEKMMANAFKYGEITYDSLEFRVQVSAFKNNQHYFFPKLEKFGKIEKVELGDGYKRLMLGGSFKSYGRAFAYAKKIIKAGHDDVFIVVVYKGYRYSVEDLEAVGIFKSN